MGKDFYKADLAVEQAARRIAAALSTLISKLPDSVAPERAIEMLSAELVRSQPNAMRWLAEYTHNCEALLDTDDRYAWRTAQAVRAALSPKLD